MEQVGERSIARALAWMGGAAALIAAGSVLPVIGVDLDALEGEPPFHLLPPFNLALPAAPLIGSAVATLVSAQLVLWVGGWVDSARARLIALGCYLGITALSSIAFALHLESLSDLYGMGVVEPGTKYRALVVLPSLAMASILWWITSRITASGAAHGALAIALVDAMLNAPFDGWTLGSRWSFGSTIADVMPSLVLPVVALVLVGVVLWIRPPPRWPVAPIKRLSFRSWIDVAGAPLALYLVIGVPLSNVLLTLHADDDASAGGVSPWIAPLGTLAFAIVLAVVWMKKVEGAGPRTSLGVLMGGLFAVLSIGGAAAAIAQLGPPLGPGVLSGDDSYEITLAANDSSFEEGEAAAMVERLDSLGASAEIVRQEPMRITLRVDDAIADEDVILDALRPRMLSLHFTEPLFMDELPEGAHGRDGRIEGSCPVLEELLVPCEPRMEYLAEDQATERTGCVLHCIEPSPVITGDHVSHALVVHDEMGAPAVSLTLNEAGADRMHRASSENIGRVLAIVLDDEVLSAPIVQSAMSSRIMINLGGFRSQQEMLEEASVLAEAFSSDTRLTTEWSVENVRRIAR